MSKNQKENEATDFPIKTKNKDNDKGAKNSRLNATYAEPKVTWQQKSVRRRIIYFLPELSRWQEPWILPYH